MQAVQGIEALTQVDEQDRMKVGQILFQFCYCFVLVFRGAADLTFNIFNLLPGHGQIMSHRESREGPGEILYSTLCEFDSSTLCLQTKRAQG